MSTQYFEVRNSHIHGKGGFATRRIPNGTRIIEYQGERISAEEGDRRYEDAPPDSIILLFTIDKNTVIDAGVNGNEARFINHSCGPNCESVTVGHHVYIESIRTIYPGEELTYDYSLTREDGDQAEAEKEYACHCGSPDCRGTMLEPMRKPKAKKRKSKGKRK
jgi:SET domain-containing protein